MAWPDLGRPKTSWIPSPGFNVPAKTPPTSSIPGPTPNVAQWITSSMFPPPAIAERNRSLAVLAPSERGVLDALKASPADYAIPAHFQTLETARQQPLYCGRRTMETINPVGPPGDVDTSAFYPSLLHRPVSELELTRERDVRRVNAVTTAYKTLQLASLREKVPGW